MNIVQLIRARAPYLKALQDAFAGELPAGSRFSILWSQFDNEPAPDVLPTGPNVEVTSIASKAITSKSWSLWPQEAVASRLPSREVWCAIRARRPDLIWMHEYSPYTLTGLLYAKWHRIPVVVSSEIGRGNAHFFSRAVRIWHRVWGKLADGFIACCPAACEPLAATPVPVIEAFHAVDSRVFTPAITPPHNNALTFAYAGHLVPRKGLDLLLAAAQHLKTLTTQPFRLRIIGSGDADAIRQLAGNVDLEFTGFLTGDSLRDAMRTADVFVLPTRQDTYAAVVHEAACLGLPLLISKHAGASQAIQTGFTIDPHDTGDFARHMLAMFDPQTRATMRTASRHRGEELSAHHRAHALWQWMSQNFLSA
ncbi:MAG: glycosyltransferase family 4 protein [Verrucomicrobiaceae bacterium]|nr:glycosyltransferase family 4 protein [Verrucomicrobiaceae bacterium]